MQVVALNCNNCGAPLEAPRKARFLTCGFCNSRLEIKRHGDAHYTEVLEEISRDVKEIKKAISADREIQSLDRSWETERKQFLVTDKHGHQHIPNSGAALVGGGVAAIFGVFWIVMASNIGAPGPMVAFGFLFIGVAVFGSISHSRKADAFRKAQRRYFEKRHEISARRKVEED